MFLKNLVIVLLVLLVGLLLPQYAFASIYDDFNDGVIDTNMWEWESYASPYFSESGGKLNFDIPDGWNGVVNLWLKDQIEGDFDLKIDFENYSFTASPLQTMAQAGLVLKDPLNPSIGDLIINRETWEGGERNSVKSILGSNGSFDFSGIETTLDSGTFRVTRISDSLSSYFHDGDSWNQTGHIDNAYTGPMEARLRVGGTANLHVEFDNFELEADGLIGSGSGSGGGVPQPKYLSDEALKAMIGSLGFALEQAAAKAVGYGPVFPLEVSAYECRI